MTAKANPDGYTLLATSPSFAIQPSISAKLPFDPLRDFAPITQATAAPYLLVLYPGVEAKSVKELIDLAKANPGKLNYASGGIGSAQHLTAELFRLMAGINIVHVPFKGAVNVPDVIAGRVQMLFSGLPQGLPHVQAGRLRALGVTTPARSPAVPDVPTIAEAGVPGFEVTVWYGILATGRTPKAIVDKLNAGIVKALQSADVRQQLTSLGLEPVGNAPPRNSARKSAPRSRNGRKVVKRAGIAADVSLFVRAPRQRVWEVINDYERAPEFMRGLQTSKIISRSGDTLRVYQKDQVRFGPFTFPVETVKDVRLTEPVRTESRLVSGSIKKYESTTELISEAGGTRIVYRSVANPGSFLAGFIGESSVRRETEERFNQVRSEILRRQYVAAKQ